MKNTLWRHKKRGTTYKVVRTAVMQDSKGDLDEAPVIVYESIDDPELVFVRSEAEFMDGRFERVEDHDTTPNGWLFFSQSTGAWHWSKTLPQEATQSRPATSWERFFFNRTTRALQDIDTKIEEVEANDK